MLPKQRFFGNHTRQRQNFIVVGLASGRVGLGPLKVNAFGLEPVVTKE